MSGSKRSWSSRTECLPVSGRGALRAAVDALLRGGVVAIPTETVYGLVVRSGDRSARARLRRVKGRAADKPFQLLLSSRRAALALCSGNLGLARKLARAFWPGPLTLVARGRNGRWIGLRVPDHPVPRRLARGVGGALVATSANPAGGRPARNAEGIMGVFRNKIDLVLDGGASGTGKASTVVRVLGDTWEMLREGAITRRKIREVAGTPPARKGKPK